jgi:glycosyltransferase involved in cell wall biosynthesis
LKLLRADADTLGVAAPTSVDCMTPSRVAVPIPVTLLRLAAKEQMGQQVYEDNLARELDAFSEQVDVEVVSFTSMRASLPGRRLPLGRLRSAPLWLQRAAARVAYPRTGVLHRLDLRLPASDGPEILTIHDVAPLVFDDEGRMPRHAAASAQAAELVICPSRFAAREVTRALRVTRTTVIPNGLDPLFRVAVPLSEDERRHMDLPSRWVLHTGGASERKNLGALASCWPHVRQRFPDVGLVMCGPPHPSRTKLFADLPGVSMLGHVERSTLASLMASSSVVVVPSTYEGFGLPALEAMATGTPVVASASGALPEVCGDNALLVEPTAEGIGKGVIAALCGALDDRLDAARRSALKRTWQACASAHVEVYAESWRRRL